MSAVSEKIFVGGGGIDTSNMMSPNENKIDKERDFRLMSSGTGHETIARLTNNDTDQKLINNFLTSDGESDKNQRFDIGGASSIDGRNYALNGHINNTNYTSSTLKNVPMSYSSTNSQGYLNNRF